MNTYKKSLWVVVPAVALVATFVWNNSAVARKNVRKANNQSAELAWYSPTGINASAFAVCESTGFEAVEGPCGWEMGYMCGAAYTFCPPGGGAYAASCTGNPAADIDCCLAFPNPMNGWYQSGTNQHCAHPYVSNLNPSPFLPVGEQHLRMERDAIGGNPAGCTGFGGACRVNAFTPSIGANPPGKTTMTMDIAMSADILSPPFGSSLLYFSVDDTPGGSALAIYFHAYGIFFFYTYETDSYAFGGYMTGSGIYDRVVAELDPCENSAKYYVNGVLAVDTRIDEGEHQISRAIFNSNNIGFLHDVDNYSVVREQETVSVCGDNVRECIDEECDGTDDANCPGRCLADCTCDRPFDACDDPRPVVNGANGPYLTDGGFYTYTADTAFTSVNTCGSDYDTVLRWNVFNLCAEQELLNDECNELTSDLGQDAGDPSAPCYVTAGAPPFEPTDFPLASCLCAATTPSTAYVFHIAEFGSTEPALGGNTVVNITKKTACGSPIPGGACCHGITGTCVDGVSAAECNGPFDTYSFNKLCSMVGPCVAIEGACCDSAPGAGGSCSQTTQANCTGQYLTWTPAVECSTVACAEVQGACCDRLTGSCSSTLQAACNCADCVWTVGGACGSTPCVTIQGACCVQTEQTAECTQTSQAACATLGGTWTRETDCSAVECEPLFTPIPTVSEWGLVIMALMLLVGGKVYFGRRQAVTA